jgi:MFS family permease
MGERTSQVVHVLRFDLPLLDYECEFIDATMKDGEFLLNHHLKGYDGSLMGSINSLKTYQTYYNVPENDLAGTGIVFSIFQIGQMAGALFIWVADWRGRRLPIFVGCVGVCVGMFSGGHNCLNKSNENQELLSRVLLRQSQSLLGGDSCFPSSQPLLQRRHRYI